MPSTASDLDGDQFTPKIVAIRGVPLSTVQPVKDQVLMMVNGVWTPANVDSAQVLALSNNSATPAINTDLASTIHITNQTAAITSFTSGLTGTPVDGQEMQISITGTAAVALTWGTSFEPSLVALPTTTVLTNRIDIYFTWNTVTAKWRCAQVF